MADTREFEAGKHLLNTKHNVQLTHHIFLHPTPKEPQLCSCRQRPSLMILLEIPWSQAHPNGTEEHPSGTLPPT